MEASAHEPVRKLWTTEGELEPDLDKVCSRTLSPRVSKSRLRRVSSSCPSKCAWDKGGCEAKPDYEGVEPNGQLNND